MFRPQTIDGRRLVDGGLLNPVPVTPLIREPADYLFAISVDGAIEAAKPEIANDHAIEPDSGYRRRIGEFIGKLMPHGEKAAGAKAMEPPRPRDPGMLDLLAQSMDLMQANLARLRLAAYAPDLLIQLPRNISMAYEFYRARELIELGRERALLTLADWKPAHHHHHPFSGDRGP